MSAPLQILLAAEGPTDVRRMKTLAEHCLGCDRSWKFRGLDSDEFVKIKKIPELAREKGLSRRYGFGGPKQKRDAGLIRNLFVVLHKEGLLVSSDAVIWCRDDDGDDARRVDAEHAQAASSSPPLLLAIASECGEAWYVAGWRARTWTDEQMLQASKHQLGFDPVQHPERLSHKKNAPKSAKREHERLFDGDRSAEADALIKAMNPRCEGGNRSGLHAFCDELRAWVAKCS